jgi:hypothetical protein
MILLSAVPFEIYLRRNITVTREKNSAGQSTKYVQNALAQDDSNIFSLGPKIVLPLNPRARNPLLTLFFFLNKLPVFVIFNIAYSDMTNFYMLKCVQITIKLHIILNLPLQQFVSDCFYMEVPG